MLVIGLTGPTGAGKGEVAAIFARYGIPVINADRVYHELITPPSSCLQELVDAFGKEILLSDGNLDRRALGGIVFNDPAARERLNTITHRYVMEEVKTRMERFRRDGIPVAVFDAPQLFEADAHRACGAVISVLADRQLRLERIMMRDKITAEAARRRILAQKSDAFFKSHSDYIIENNGAAEALAPQVHGILVKLGVISR
ncbi:MAG: dephospho-CoA kinase [Ruminococcaceae bacterium]|nr:dephospho-CoA kinase [Oscillospiraceae bacterium]